MVKNYLPLRWAAVYALLFLAGRQADAQVARTYLDSLTAYSRDYIQTHEVVKGADRAFLQFFALDSSYRILAHFERLPNNPWISMPTSGRIRKSYRQFGKIQFSMRDTLQQLFLYQSKSLMETSRYRDYLFIPFTDGTTGIETYGAGRYLDFTLGDIQDSVLRIDFNKAYNPFCAYTTGYDCPIPPAENALQVSIRAGEKAYGRNIHH
jgi:uncharacterized protein (DUF1684 family)